MDSRLVLLLVSLCVTLVSATSKIPKCGPGDINKIQAYWKNTGGTPTYIVNSKDTFQVVLGTNSPVAGDWKCKHFNFIPPTGYQKSYILNILESKSKVPVSESNGVLTATASGVTYTIYVIAFTGNILVFYKCSGDGPNVSRTVVPDVTIAVRKGINKKEIASMTTAIKRMGFGVGSFGCKQ